MMRNRMVHWNEKVDHGVKIKMYSEIERREKKKKREKRNNSSTSTLLLLPLPNTQPACLQVPQGWLPTGRLPMADLLPKPPDGGADPWAYLPWT